MPQRPMRNVRSPSTRTALGMSPQHVRMSVRCSFTCRRTTSSPATPHAVRRNRYGRARNRVRPQQARGGTRGRDARSAKSLHRANLVAVRWQRRQLPHDHDAVGARAGARVGRRRSAWFPDLGARPRASAHRSRQEPGTLRRSTTARTAGRPRGSASRKRSLPSSVPIRSESSRSPRRRCAARASAAVLGPGHPSLESCRPRCASPVARRPAPCYSRSSRRLSAVTTLASARGSTAPSARP